MIRKWLEHKCFPNHPKVATAEEWVEWEKFEKSKKWCNFIVNTIPHWFEKLNNRMQRILMWCRYRVQPSHKYHLIDTGLTPTYHEIDTRMLHGMFNMLKEFCEEEQPYHDWCWTSIDDENKGKKPKKFKRGREAALESFKWQKALVYKAEELDSVEDAELIGKPTEQAKRAEEIEKLYLWWVDVYPNRRDPFEVYEDPYFDKLIENNEPAMKLLCSRPPEEEAAYKERIKKIDELERQYDLEEEMMLTRLIKIRHSLWT